MRCRYNYFSLFLAYTSASYWNVVLQIAAQELVGQINPQLETENFAVLQETLIMLVSLTVVCPALNELTPTLRKVRKKVWNWRRDAIDGLAVYSRRSFSCNRKWLSQCNKMHSPARVKIEGASSIIIPTIQSPAGVNGYESAQLGLRVRPTKCPECKQLQK